VRCQDRSFSGKGNNAEGRQAIDDVIGRPRPFGGGEHSGFRVGRL